MDMFKFIGKTSPFFWGDPGVYAGDVLTILRSFLIVFVGSLLSFKAFSALFLWWKKGLFLLFLGQFLYKLIKVVLDNCPLIRKYYFFHCGVTVLLSYPNSSQLHLSHHSSHPTHHQTTSPRKFTLSLDTWRLDVWGCPVLLLLLAQKVCVPWHDSHVVPNGLSVSVPPVFRLQVVFLWKAWLKHTAHLWTKHWVDPELMWAALERKATRIAAASRSIPKPIPWSQSKPFFHKQSFLGSCGPRVRHCGQSCLWCGRRSAPTASRGAAPQYTIHRVFGRAAVSVGVALPFAWHAQCTKPSWGSCGGRRRRWGHGCLWCGKRSTESIQRSCGAARAPVNNASGGNHGERRRRWAAAAFWW